MAYVDKLGSSLQSKFSQASNVVELSTKLPKANRKCKCVPPGSVVALLEEFDVSTLG